MLTMMRKFSRLLFFSRPTLFTTLSDLLMRMVFLAALHFNTLLHAAKKILVVLLYLHLCRICRRDWSSWLHHTATQCIKLQHTSLRSSYLMYSSVGSIDENGNLDCITLQHTASHCNALLLSSYLIYSSVGSVSENGNLDCNTLQHKATHCNTMQHTASQCSFCPTWFTTLLDLMKMVILIAKYCNTLQDTATDCNTLQHTAAHCNTLHHTAAHCNTLHTMQHTASHCNTLLLSSYLIYNSVGSIDENGNLDCITLQHTASHCTTLHHTATHCCFCLTWFTTL